MGTGSEKTSGGNTSLISAASKSSPVVELEDTKFNYHGVVLPTSYYMKKWSCL